MDQTNEASSFANTTVTEKHSDHELSKEMRATLAIQKAWWKYSTKVYEYHIMTNNTLCDSQPFLRSMLKENRDWLLRKLEIARKRLKNLTITFE